MTKCYVIRKENAYLASEIDPLSHVIHYYPEADLSMTELFNFKPPVDCVVVTENPWIIGCYHQDDVVVVGSSGQVISTNFETFGASVNKITMSILGRRSTISSVAQAEIDKFREKATKLTTENDLEEVIRDIGRLIRSDGSAVTSNVWVPARPENSLRKHRSFRHRLGDAWKVFMCQADAFT